MKFEYKVKNINSVDLEKVNELGSEGWEMCGISDKFMWFKKQKLDLEYINFIENVIRKQEEANIPWYGNKK